jgi:hypothetical protein
MCIILVEKPEGKSIDLKETISQFIWLRTEISNRLL